ncbi:MAG: MerR family transcriptional regulator [Oscillochloris sp.]|nr:MerR family transcriptional regulator [Oscillochloris sp.]
MNERELTFTVQEFARLAQVSVRTLHHYDTINLLKPSERSASGRRRYRRSDLLRLQQILTMKYLGFSLAEIGRLLDRPDYDLRTSLHTQHSAITQHILDLQAVAFAIKQTMATLEIDREPDWNQVIAIISGLSDAKREDWISRFYPPEVWAWLRERAAQTPPEMLHAGVDEWQALYRDFAAVQQQQYGPESPQAQQLAARMQQLIDIFTNRDPQIEAGLRKLYRERGPQANPLAAQLDPALRAFIDQARSYFARRET